MPTTFVKGDILEETPVTDGTRAFAFGGDIDGSMENGIAIAFRKRWPELAEAWSARCAGNKMQLGDAFAWKDGETVVYVLGLQRGGNKSKVSWLERSLQSMVAAATRDGVTRISMPRLATGKTGIDGARVKRVVTELGDGTSIALVVFEQFIRAKQADAPVEAEEEAEATEDEEAAPKTKKAAAKKKTVKTVKAVKKAAAAPKKKAAAAPKKKSATVGAKTSARAKKAAGKEASAKKKAAKKKAAKR